MGVKTIVDLLTPISEATLAGRLKWVESRSAGYETKVGPRTIHVWSGEDEVGFGFVSARILDQHGEVLDHVTSSELGDLYSVLLDFENTARRSAKNFDAVAKDIIADLQRLAS